MRSTESPLGGVELVATSFYVSDLDQAIAWYAEKLGLDPMTLGADGDRYAAYSIGGALLVLEPREAAIEPGEPGSETSTVNLLVSRDPGDVRQDLVERGVTCSELVESPNFLSFLIRDRDGNRFYVSRAVSEAARETVRDVSSAGISK
jgi:catechol 2,3-dioxygenase-like lactoylglutathione lyase family enzyme